MATTEADQKKVVQRISTEVYGGGNLDLIDDYFAEDFVSHNPVAGEIHGPEEYKEFVSMFRAAFPDMEVSIEDQLSEGEKVVERHTVRGTHEGELLGIEPTGKEIAVEGVVIVRFEDGKVAEEWAHGDMMGLLEQLGVVEAPG